MSTDGLTLFTQIMQAQNINVVQLEAGFSNLYKADMMLRYKLYSGYDFLPFQNFITSHCTNSEIMKMKDDFSLIFYILQAPGGAFGGNQGIYLIAGPVLEAPLTVNEIQKIMFRKKLPDQLFKDLQIYYGSIPVPPDCRVLESTMLTVAESLFSRDFKLHSYPEEGDISFELSPDTTKLNETPSIAIASIEERYEVEDKMLQAVTYGDYSGAVRYHTQFKNYRITPRDENALQNRKSLCIVLNTLCRKAVQKGHVHPIYIDDLSTRLAIQINKVRSMNELEAIDSDMLHKYCLLVRNHSMKNYSQLIRRCITYLDFHYAEPLTLAFFADMFHVTRSYLSTLFKKETGTNLTEYIHSVRIQHALVLLNSTQLPIHVVAVSCGYNDINYFIKMFKRVNGVSPKQYQLQLNKA